MRRLILPNVAYVACILGMLLLFCPSAKAQNCIPYFPNPATFPFFSTLGGAQYVTVATTTEADGTVEPTVTTMTPIPTSGLGSIVWFNPRTLVDSVFGSTEGDALFQSCGGVFPPAGAQSVDSTTAEFTQVLTVSDTNGTINITAQGTIIAMNVNGECPGTCLLDQGGYTTTYVYHIQSGGYTISQNSSEHTVFIDTNGNMIDSTTTLNGTASGTWPLNNSCSVTVKPFTQSQSPWGSTTYDHTTEFMKDAGCSLTTLTMALNAANGTSSFDPGALNDLLTNSPGGYAPFVTKGCPTSQACGDLSFDQGAAAASLGTLKLFGKSIDSSVNQQDAAAFLDNALCTAGRPVIVGVTGSRGKFPGHFLLVTGKQGDTYTVINPGSAVNTNTTLDTFGRYVIRGYVADPAGDLSRLDMVTDVTVDLLVTDPTGTQTGLVEGATGEDVQNIPQSYHFTDALDDDSPAAAFTIGESHTIGIFQPVQGRYQIAVIGMSLGTFDVEISPIAQDGTPLETISLVGVASPASNSTFHLQFSSLPGTSSTASRAATFDSTLADIANSLALGLIDNAGIADALSSKIQAARSAASSSQNQAARNILNAFLNQLSAQTGKHVTGVAPQILLEDAESLISQLQ